ncbi:Gti1/Pac2 family-domain-containing protein, partial [Lineolata rhizophorae]
SAAMQPTWIGFVNTTEDSLLLLEACLQGLLNHCPRRPHDRERAEIIRSGSIFVYEENASGIKRWTDGLTWSPSRILGNYLVYRELSAPFPPGEKKRALPRNPYVAGATEVMHPDEDRMFHGSLTDSYQFKEDGLVKRTLCVPFRGCVHHIVCYYKAAHVKAGVIHTPSEDSNLKNLTIRPDLIVACQNNKMVLDG